MPTKPLRVAIVHDWLVSPRGGERVLDSLCEIFPEAEIFTLFYRKGRTFERIEKRRIHTSYLNYFPSIERYYRYLLPLFPLAAERLNLKGFDLIVSTSHCVAKGIIPPPQSVHICICFTTMRYAWDQNREYFGNGLKQWLVSPFLHYLRMWDVTSSARVDHFIAISRFIAQRIEKYYRRTAQVVYPFVDLERFTPSHGEKGDYYLLVSAFAPYKRVELAIEACRRLGRRLLVVGEGQDATKLRRLRGTKIEFLGSLPDSELPDLYAGARALLFPGTEDFGITPLEAMASGTPVIAFGEGGVLETVIDGETGLFFQEPSVSSLVEAIQRFENHPGKISSQSCRARAERFTRKVFQKEVQGIVHRILQAELPPPHKAPTPQLPSVYLDQ